MAVCCMQAPWTELESNFLGNALCQRFNQGQTLQVTKPCPEVLRNITVACVSVDPSARPEFKDVIAGLQTI